MPALQVALWADSALVCNALLAHLPPQLPLHSARLHPLVFTPTRAEMTPHHGTEDAQRPIAYDLHLLLSPDAASLRQHLMHQGLPFTVLHGSPAAQAKTAADAIRHQRTRGTEATQTTPTAGHWRWLCTHCDEPGLEAI